MTFLELAETVLRETLKPMSVGEIWNYAEQKGYVSKLKSKGKTPWDTLAAQMYTTKSESFTFVGARPKRFYLPGITSADSLDNIHDSSDFIEKKLSYKERDLHQVLAHFIDYHFGAYSKTINHSRSTKKKYMQWMHPDMVACSFPGLELDDDVFELSNLVNNPPIKLYSFEIKLQLNFGNLRESFFQAVSNSSWANEGYLVTANLQYDIEFMMELSRLSSSFGIGIIELDLIDINGSEIVNEAKTKEDLDWLSINNLSIHNKDFNEFVRRIRKDMISREIRKEWYDSVKEADELERIFEKLI